MHPSSRKSTLRIVVALALLLSLGLLVPPASSPSAETPALDVLRVPCAEAKLQPGQDGTLDLGTLKCQGAKRTC